MSKLAEFDLGFRMPRPLLEGSAQGTDELPFLVLSRVPGAPRRRVVRAHVRWGRQRAERELAALDSLPHITDAVVHGDLGAENVLWEFNDGLPGLSGVIDWDEVTIGDPAEDLAAVGASYGPHFLNRVLTLGGWSDSTVATRIAIIRRTFALQQALSAHRDGDEEQLADGLTGYR